MDEKQIAAVDRLLHKLLWGLHVKSLDAWTPELEQIGALGLHVVKMAAESPDRMLGDIRAQLEIPHSTLTSIVNRLESKGLLTRTIHPQDRRSFGLRLTAEGRRINRAHERLDREVAQRILDSLGSDAERRQFIALADKIIRGLT